VCPSDGPNDGQAESEAAGRCGAVARGPSEWLEQSIDRLGWHDWTTIGDNKFGRVMRLAR
jgi:hypothetical protein